ncbi:MAG: CheR family methyltransferase, partial [Planctomycetota bacterium]
MAAPDLPNLAADAQAQLATFLHREIGHAIPAGKHDIVAGKVAPIMRDIHALSVHDLIVQVRKRPDLRQRLINAVTINETYFFREPAVWPAFARDVLPYLVANTSGSTIQFLVCACSTGQEAYSLAMLLDEERGQLGGRSWRITALDIDSAVLDHARAGRYTRLQASRGLSDERRQRHCVRDGDGWRVKDDLRARVSFQCANLTGRLNALGLFHMILCRNVLIYFDEVTKGKVVDGLSKHLYANGTLAVGSCESFDDTRTTLSKTTIGSTT